MDVELKMKKYLAVLALLCIITLYGCSKEKPQQIPEAIAAGFYGEGSVQNGGTAAEGAGDINAKALVVSSRRDGEHVETVLEFNFVTGSRMSGSEQETTGCGVPQYSVFAYDSPARLVVQFENLAFWDYRHGLSLNHDWIRGTFQQSVFGSPKISIYFQLDRPVYFLAEASEDTLSIRLWAKESEDAEANEDAETNYYVTANAYDLYRAGTISMEINASPTFASDMQNILLISPPMQTEEEAAAYLLNVKRQYPAIPGELWNICTLASQALPEYDTALDYLSSYQTPVVRLEDGSLLTLPVLVPDGLYLCNLPGGEGFLYSKELPAEEEEGNASQQLMIMQPGRTGTPALSFDFAAIEYTQFSPDGRKLALLESSGGGFHLYIFDANTYELLNDLSEMGFGSNTSSFIWNSLGNIVYAITGESAIQLHQFDYSIPDETKRHTVVDRSNVDEGSLGFCDGELYFTLATMEEGSMI